MPRVPLDAAGRHWIAFDPDTRVLELVAPGGDRRSRAHEAFAESLRVRELDGPSGGRGLHLSAGRVVGERAVVFVEDPLGRLVVAQVTGRALESTYRLSPFELRYAEDNGAIHPVVPSAREAVSFRPRTDLHTHFAGCVRASTLVEMGASAGLSFSQSALAEAGIRVEQSAVPVAELSPAVRARLAGRLEVPFDRRITFAAMEAIYRLRAPLTKSPALFGALCRQIANDYAAQGVRYAELSLGSVVEASVLRAIHREMPAIERATGTTLRFLVAISRHDDPEWDLDLVERIREVGASGYIAGVDFMGHETNSTSAFAPVIRSIADWAHAARPGFVIRVHAGESPSHPENVRLAIEAVAGRDVSLRIGHGLFGVDDATLAALVRTRTIVEFNLDSNVALNHLQSGRDVALRRYVERGARVVLGSDGYGIYGTDPESIARAALIAGLSMAQLGALRAVEDEYLEETRLRQPADFAVPDDRPPVHFTPAVIARRRALQAESSATLRRRLADIGVPLLSRKEVETLVGQRPKVLSIAGAWRHSWDGMTDGQRRSATRALEVLVASLDPARTLLVTGGTTFGVEGVAARAARGRGIEVLAAIVEATPPDALDGSLASKAYVVGETLYDKASGLYALVAAHDGACLFVGGGQIVSDEIQTARNLHLRYLLFVGAGGASEQHALERPALAVRSGAEIIAAVVAWRGLDPAIAPHWFAGANPCVDLVVIRGGEVLLVLRDRDAPAAPGVWALPGGYVASAARRGEAWVASETHEAAALRELTEETGLVLDEARLRRVGVFEGGDRDPRDDARGWAQSTAFLVELSPDEVTAIAGGEDAVDARWWNLGELPRLAFDHARVVDSALELKAELDRSPPDE